MSGGGSQTSTSSTTVPPQFLNAYTNTVNRAQGVASQPYQAYTGNLVAGFSGDQSQAQQQVRNLQGSYNPLLGQAAGAVGASTKPLWSSVSPIDAQTIGKYENPYQSQVIAATQAQIGNTDAQQQNQLEGQAGAAGAFGGNRLGVAQGVLGGQQAIANNSTLAGLNQSNYAQALQEANQQQQAQLGANEANAWLNSQAGYAYGNLAQEGNSLGLTDASALATSGLTQQQQQQAGLNTAYEQWQARQAFPYQQTGWLANITEGIGSNVGGTSTTTQTNNADGGRVPRAAGGIVPSGYDVGGGTPYGYVQAPGGISIIGDTPDPATSYIPGASGTGGGGGGGIGRGPPQAPQVQQQQDPWGNPATDIAALNGAVSLGKGLGIGDTTTQIGQAALGNGWVLNAPAAMTGGADAGATAAGSPGFMGLLGSALDAVPAGLTSAATGLTSAAAGSGAIGTGLASAGAGVLDFLGSLLAFLHTGGRVGNDNSPELQHHAAGGNVVPFPSHLARGGIAAGMPYTEAPPVPVQATGTYGGISQPPMGYMGGAAPSSFAGNSAGISAPAMWLTPSGQGTNTNPFGAIGTPNPAAFRRGGGIGRHGFADGGDALPTMDDVLAGIAPAATDDSNPLLGPVPTGSRFNGATIQAGPAASPGIAVPAPQPAAPDAGENYDNEPGAPSPGIAAATSGYTPDKPNLWLPAVAGLATAALGRHANAGRNIAEGVLAGLGSYNQENTAYQGEREKAASLDQEARQLADNALWHKEQLAHEGQMLDETSRHNQADETTAAQRVASETQYQGVAGSADMIRANAEAQRAAQDHFMPIPGAVDKDGHPLLYDQRSGNVIAAPFAAGVNPNVGARVNATERGQDLQHGDRVARLSQDEQIESDRLAQQYGQGAAHAANAILFAHKDPATGLSNITYDQAKAEAAKTYPQFFQIPGRPGTVPAAQGELQQGAAPTAFQEGQTATNPQTGERRVYKGGDWVPQ